MYRADHPSDGRLSRRTLLAGAAAGAVGATTGTASAQRCPGPPHVKGPLVWLDLDQQELRATPYAESVYAAQSSQYRRTCQANSSRRRFPITWTCRSASPMAKPEDEKLDIYRRTSRDANAPINFRLVSIMAAPGAGRRPSSDSA